MRTMLVIVVVALLGFFAAIWIASEQGGEVVTLRTTSPGGEVHETRLWIVEIGPDLWLRAGDPGSSWLGRLRQNPDVEVERRGRNARYRAALVPHMGPEVNARMAEKYGWADRLIGVIRGDGSIAVRLDPQA